MTFSNGWTISVQNGPGLYNDNRDKSFTAPSPSGGWESSNAEVAIWQKGEDMIRLRNDENVLGWTSPDLIGKLMGYLSKSTASEAKIVRAGVMRIIRAAGR